jgi:hypothetical protein
MANFELQDNLSFSVSKDRRAESFFCQLIFFYPSPSLNNLAKYFPEGRI